MFNYYDKEKEDYRLGKIIFHSVSALILLVLIFTSFGTVGAGQRGILLQFSGITGKVFNEGLYFKIPFVQRVVKMDVRTLKMENETLAYSNDLQTVTTKIALNYHIEPLVVNKLYQEIGIDYENRIISPFIQEVIKSVVANYKAQELIEKREKVKDEIKSSIKDRLNIRYIMVDEFSITNFDFSPEYEKAIEAKQVAQQDALKAENILTKIKIEAEQKIAEARGKAQALQIEGDALKSAPQIAELRWIEKWNGQVPAYWGNATPFVGLTK